MLDGNVSCFAVEFVTEGKKEYDRVSRKTEDTKQ